MKYSTPELVVIGSASAVVLGRVGPQGDNINPDFEELAEGFAIGLDD